MGIFFASSLFMEQFRKLVLKCCAQAIAAKKEMLLGEIAQINESLSTATKSTAGDKHETGRAHMQAEQDKLQKMLAALTDMGSALENLSPGTHGAVSKGSLVRSGMGYFLFGPALGSVMAGDQKVHVLSFDSPLGQAMQGKRAGDTVRVNGNDFLILEIA